jgi:site-specific DNA recombinase
MQCTWGRRAQRLEPDPATARVVAWISAQRLAGHSVARIARGLNDAASRAPQQRTPALSCRAWFTDTATRLLLDPGRSPL